MKKVFKLLIFLFLAGIHSILSIGCSEEKPTKTNPVLRYDEIFTVVTTTTQITDLVRQIAGDFCKVIPLMGAGVDPHLYKPTARDMAAVVSADLVVFHGLKFEGKLSEALEKARGSKVRTYAACSILPAKRLLSSEEGDGIHPDPHVWFDPELWSACAHGIAEQMGTLIPNEKKTFEERSQKLQTRYREIADWSKKEFSEIPPWERKLITSHDAFRYFGRAFDLEVIALQGISTATEAGLGDRANLVDYVTKNKVPALFVESSVNPTALQEIARETGASLGSALFSDALGSSDEFIVGPAGKRHPLSTWSGMMIHNVRAVIEGLRGGKDE